MGKRTDRKRADLVTALREAVRKAEAAGASQRSIAIGASIDPAQLFRFMERERTLTLPAAALLAEYLALELRPRRRPKGTH